MPRILLATPSTMAWCHGMTLPASFETMVWISQNISLRFVASVSARVSKEQLVDPLAFES